MPYCVLKGEIMRIRKRNFDSKFDNLQAPLPFNGRYGAFETWNRKRATGTCIGCSNGRTLEQHMLAPQNALGYMDQNGNRRTYFCFYCLDKLANRFLQEDVEHSKYRALYRLCSITGHYYSDVLAHKLFEEKNYWDNDKEISLYYPWAILYMRAVMEDEELSQKTFFESDNFIFQDVINKQYEPGSTALLSESAKRNRRAIISIYHYDPFEEDPVEERGKLYEDLITISDESMATDLVKARASIEIVRTFSRIDKINRALITLQVSPDSMISHSEEIKELINQKKKETDMVTAFSKDHGFAEKYANAKSKGAGTLGAIVRDMEEYGYDRGKVNLYDIETSAGMRQVADISAQSIFKQLSLTSAEYSDIVKEQGERIRSMQATMEKQAEELRLLREKHLKAEILEEYRQELLGKGINPIEIDALIEEELQYKPVNIGTSYYTAEELQNFAPESSEDR